MESTERIKYSRPEMFRLSSSVADKTIDLTQYGVADDNNRNLDEECLVNKFESVKDLREACRACSSRVPTKSRTYRVVVGTQTYNFEKGVYYNDNIQMIADGNNSSSSNKRSGDEDFIVYGDDHEEEASADKKMQNMTVDEKNSNPPKKRYRDENFVVYDDDYEEERYNKKRQNVIVDEKNSSSSNKHSHDENFIAFDGDYEEEESYDKKRQKKIERKRKVSRKPVQVYNLHFELPQNFREYISGLNLEVPPLFVAQKLLTVSDINSNLGRLLLPISLVNTEFSHNFLTQDEKKHMKKTKPVEVNLVDDMMREYCSLHMTKWDMNTSSPYVLRRAWNNVVAENKLKIINVSKDKNIEKIVGTLEDDNKLLTDMVARVWTFRRGSDIWFALNIQAMKEFKVLNKTKEECYIIE